MSPSIRAISGLDELKDVYAFATPILALPSGIHTLEYYAEQLAKTPQLSVVAEQDGRICGCILASVEGDHVLVGPVAVAADSRGKGIGSAMMREIEQQAKEIGQDTLVLGALEGTETFYLGCGFQPNLFIQAPEPDSGERLRSLNQRYEVIWESQQDGWSKLLLRTPVIDKDLQREYQRRFPACSTQYVFVKHIR